MSFGAAQWGQVLALKALVKALQTALGGTGTLTGIQLRGTSTASNSLTVNDQPLILGDIAGLNLIASRSGLVARSNGVASNLNLNTLGGNVTIGNAASIVILNGSQLKFANATNSADVDTLDGYKDWLVSTPTPVGLGTPAINQYLSKRVGDNLSIKGKIQAGTVTGVEVRIPLLLNGVALTADATKVPAAVEPAGICITNTNSATFFGFVMLIESGATYLTLGGQSSAGNAYTKVLGTAVGNNNLLGFTAEVPISGW